MYQYDQTRDGWLEHRLRNLRCGDSGNWKVDYHFVGKGGSTLRWEAQTPFPHSQQAPDFSPVSGLSNGSPQRRLLYLLLLPSSPRAEESPLVCLQTASS